MHFAERTILKFGNRGRQLPTRGIPFRCMITMASKQHTAQPRNVTATDCTRAFGNHPQLHSPMQPKEVAICPGCGRVMTAIVEEPLPHEYEGPQ